MKPIEISQMSFELIRELAALCATQGIDERNIKEANDQIHDLLIAVKQATVKVTAEASGLIVN